MFVNDGHDIALAQSYAKNMGLYGKHCIAIQLFCILCFFIVYCINYVLGERVGAFSLVTGSKQEADTVMSQMKILVRPMYSNPPVHGARIASEILGDASLKSSW